jgi:hypothetical protein
MQFDQALKRLTGSDYVLLGGGFVVMQRHQRWHLMTLTYFGSVLGLHTVHFMSEARGHDTIREWITLGRILPMREVSEILPDEVEVKVLERAEDYLPWIQNGQMDLGGGSSTDAQSFSEFAQEDPSEAFAVIDKMMRKGTEGAYLRFKDTYRALSGSDQ